MSRRHVQPLLSEYIDGTLSPAVVRRIEAHLADCSECAQELARWRAVLRLVSHYAPMTCPVDCAEAVSRTIEARRAARLIGDGTAAEAASGTARASGRASITIPRLRLTAAALAFLVLLLGGVSLRLVLGLRRTPALSRLTARHPGLGPLEMRAPHSTDLRLATSIPAASTGGPVRAHAPDRLQEAFGRSDSLILAADFVEEDR